MDRKKVIYIGSLIILTVIVSITYFSYAFFTNRTEQRGKLNIVTGTLDYKIKSADLTNNSITLEANKSKQIEIEITSLNKISSKYELYYQTTASNVVVGYGSNNDTPTGVISANGKKTVKVVIKNKSNSQATITFGVEGGFINNALVLSTGNHITDIMNNACIVDLNYAWNLNYTGNYQKFDVPCDGKYRIELWGAQGGTGIGGNGGWQSSPGYSGAYVSGDIELEEATSLYFYVGQQGKGANISSNGGWNGGGNAKVLNSGYDGGGGGGATDVRYFGKNYVPTSSEILWNSALGLSSRIATAAGGCGGRSGCPGGGLLGYNYNMEVGTGSGQNIGATQSSGYSFGIGGPGTGNYQDGAGGGWYGGFAQTTSNYSGSGSTSYISGHAGCLAITEGSTSNPRTLKTGCTSSSVSSECSIHYSGLYFTNTVMIDGAGYSWTNVKGNLQQMPNPNGGYYVSGTGNTGNGHARITYLGE